MEQTKAEENLSQWFNLDDQKPWEIGVYEVEYKYGVIGCAYFNGKEFAYGWVIGTRQEKIKDALRDSNVLDVNQPIRWRGLASDPSAKPKARGNRRVTRYVVMKKSDPLSPVATYSTWMHAVRKSNELTISTPHRYYVVKVRFRSQEAS